jgi:peptidoglycan biosynthesis protein MviN/MurJ (putative lipid II flippase)
LGLAAVGVSLVVIASSDFIIDLLYGFGKMNESARMKLADLLVCYLVGTGPFLGGLVYVRALSSEGRIAVITGIAAIGVMVNIGSNAVLIKFFGLNGIGLATSLTYGINTLLLGYAFSAHFVSRRGK